MKDIIDNNFNIASKFIVNKDDESILSIFRFCFEYQSNDLLRGFALKSRGSDFILKSNLEYLNNFINSLCVNNRSYSIFFTIIKMMLDKFATITAYAEPIYIDRIHRDSYYSYYSENHLEFSRYCKRILFFKKNIEEEYDDNKEYLQQYFLGSMVIRPLKTGCIGRTLLSPHILSYKHGICSYLRVSSYKINYMGMEFEVEAFPFLTQDGIVTTCAETSILIMMDYYSNKYNDYRFVVPSDISKQAQKYVNSRVVPSNGLSYAVISKVLCTFGFFTYFHHFGKLERRRKMRNNLYYYVESGMPVCINLSKGNIGHSVVCIGHKGISLNKMIEHLTCYSDTYFTSTASGCESLIVMDDNLPPYSEYSFVNGGDSQHSLDVTRAPIQNGCGLCSISNPDILQKMTIDCFIAPLHKRMNMIASRAEEVILEMIRNDSTNPCIYFQNRNIGLENWGKSRYDPLIFRLFLVSSRHYKNKRIENPNGISQAYRLYCLGVPLPQFVWICELYNKDGYQQEQAVGEIVIDATASPKSNMFDCILMINYTYDNAFFARGLDGKVLDIIPKSQNENRQAHPAVLPITRFKENEKFTGFTLNSYKGNLTNYSQTSS